ncbi:MAG TPA: ABC transporter permease [bacterium]|nr:ABC transporter permease [bacterium]
MNGVEMIRVAVRALLRNKLRSALTALGIIIGVGAVIAMVSIGEGAKAQVQQAFASMGSNLLILLPGSSGAGGVRGGFGSQPTLTFDDIDAIRNEVHGVRGISPALRRGGQVVADDQNWSTSIYGVSPEYFDIRDWPTSSGTSFGPSDVESATKVVVLGQTVVTNLYGEGADPVGQIARIQNMPFQIVGVLKAKGQSPTGQDYDDAAYIPVSTFRQKIQGGIGNYVQGMVMLGTTSPEATQGAIRDITALLRDRHHLQPGADDDFSIRNLTEMAAQQQEGTNTVATLLAVVAFVSLVVGGIGIMNIMLVSVTERTREIGVRMAVGAKPRHVLTQFLIEATTLAVAGGVIGVSSGLAVAKWFASSSNWPMLVRPDIIVISLLFSGLVGVVFGIYPAYKASRLDPIDALRYE